MRALLLVAVALFACAPIQTRSPGPEADHPALLVETLGDVAVVALGGEAFNRLPQHERVLAYHLARSAAAAHPIVLMQNYRHDPAIWELVQGLMSRVDDLDPMFAEALRDYRRRFFLNHGVHDAWTQVKVTPGFTQDELDAAVRNARAAGATLPADQVLAELKVPIFDPMIDRLRVNRIPGTLRDAIAESSSNHYAPGTTSWDLVGFTDQHPLNSRVAKEAGKLHEEIYRAGGNGVPAGLGASYLESARNEIEAALPIAPSADQGLLRKLADAIQTGEGLAIQTGESNDVKLAFGFGDRSSDPRGRKGTFEGLVVLRDSTFSSVLGRAAALAPELERKLPRSAGGQRPSAAPTAPGVEVVRLVASAGSALAFAPLDKSWPGRATPGARRWLALDVARAEDQLLGDRMTRELVLPEVAPDAVRCGTAIRFARTAYRELVGHPRGRSRAATFEQERRKLFPYAGLLDETRAELAANILLDDPKTVTSGLLPDAGCQQVAPHVLAMEAVSSLRYVPQGEIPQDDQVRARILIGGWQVQQGAAEVITRLGRHYLRVLDAQKWKEGLGALLIALEEAESRGDRGSIEKLVEGLAMRVDPRLRDEVLVRLRRIGAPTRVAVLPPILEPTRDSGGAVADVSARAARSVDDLIEAFERK